MLLLLLRRPVDVGLLAEGDQRGGGGGRGQDGWRDGGQAAEAVRHRVRVELDLRVVKVLLPVAAV